MADRAPPLPSKEKIHFSSSLYIVALDSTNPRLLSPAHTNTYHRFHDNRRFEITARATEQSSCATKLTRNHYNLFLPSILRVCARAPTAAAAADTIEQC
jgi:hypothetical protein